MEARVVLLNAGENLFVSGGCANAGVEKAALAAKSRTSFFMIPPGPHFDARRAGRSTKGSFCAFRTASGNSRPVLALVTIMIRCRQAHLTLPQRAGEQA